MTADRFTPRTKDLRLTLAEVERAAADLEVADSLMVAFFTALHLTARSLGLAGSALDRVRVIVGFEASGRDNVRMLFRGIAEYTDAGGADRIPLPVEAVRVQCEQRPHVIRGVRDWMLPRVETLARRWEAIQAISEDRRPPLTGRGAGDVVPSAPSRRAVGQSSAPAAKLAQAGR